MADLTYEVGINTSQAQRGLDNLNKKVAGLSAAFGGLRSAIGGLAFGAAYRNALQYADAISDISDATDISIDTINSFGLAVQASGGSVQKAQAGLLKFTQSLGDAIAQGGSARKAFKELGLTDRDLETLTEEDLFKKTIAGLGKITDVSKQTRLSLELLGKAGRGVSFQGVASRMSAGVGGGDQTAAIKSAADANQNLEKIMGQLNIAILNLTKGLNDFIKNLTISQDSINKIVNGVAILIGAFVGLKVVLPIITSIIAGLRTLPGLFSLSFSQAVIFQRGTAGLFDKLVLSVMLFGKELTKVPAMFKNILMTTAAWGPLRSIFEAIRVSLGAVATAAGFLLKNLLKLAGWIGIALTIIDVVNELVKVFTGFDTIKWAIDGVTKAFNDATAAMGNFFASWAKQSTDYFGNELDFTPKVKIPKPNEMPKPKPNITPLGGVGEFDLSKFKDLEFPEATRLRELVKEFEKERKAISLASREFDNFNKNLIDNINAQAKAVRGGAAFTQQQDAVNQVLQRSAADIQTLQDRLDSLSEKEIEGGLATALQQQINLIKSKTSEYANGVLVAVKALQAEEYALQKVQDGLTVAKSKLEDYLDSMSTKIDVDAMRAQLDLVGLTGDAYDRMAAKLSMEADLKKQLNDIEADRQRLMLDSFNMAEDIFLAEMAILDQREQRARDTANAIYQIEVDRINKERALRATAQQGIADYFKQVAESMTPFEVAQKQAAAVWGGMENTIDNFVKTGKLKMKDFALSVIQDLIAIELKALALAALKTILMAFGIPMLAKGGPAMQGKPYIVGEKGPELFVPRTSGQVIPNDKMNDFGSGGGSRSQPTINNYYTVNAVDAKSVAQLFYENRKTMLGTVKTAEKELSYRI